MTLAGSVIRNLLRFVDFMPMLYVAGLITMCLSSKFKRLGDIAAGTLVVYLADKSTEQPPPKLSSDIASCAPPIPLTTREQWAVLAFSERLSLLSEQRAAEIANLLAPVTQQQGKAAIDRLKGMAQWIRGGHQQ